MTNYVMRNIFLFNLALLSCSQNNPSPPDPIIVPAVSIEIEVMNADVHTNELKMVVLPCPNDMVYIEPSQYCIDKYEAPNQKGVEPFAGKTAFQAIDYCKSIDKRLCSRKEWHNACSGPKHQYEPYGNIYKRGVCNDDKSGWVPPPWLSMGTPIWDKFCKEHYQGELSGNRPACVSGYGVYDMTGNVAEWVVDPNSAHGYEVVGGFWFGAFGSVPSCIFANPAHVPTFNSYEFGFRCCKDAHIL